MSLRMDDMNQKENAMKLSLQTVDYRLAKLEEVALQTAESLFLLQQLVTSSRILQHQMSSDLDAESSGGESSSKADIQSPPFLFPPGSAPAQLPKKHKMNEERLRPFTDYSQACQRKPFLRAVTLGAPLGGPDMTMVPSNYRVARQTSVFTRQASIFSPPPPEPKSKPKPKRIKSPPRTVSGPHLGSELYYRRRNNALSRLRHQGLITKALKEEEEPHSKKEDARVTFSDRSPHDPCQRKAFSLDAVDTLMVEQGRQESAGLDIPPTRESGNYLTDGPASHTMHLSTQMHRQISSPTPPVSIPPRRQATPPSSLPSVVTIPKPAPPGMAPITPIVTPSRSDYTTITDEIDTSGVNYTSPIGSPQTPRRIFFGVDVNVDLYTKKGKPQKTAIRTEAEQLKKAEESEHAELELVIRKRMRQISLTESDSMSDIAKHIVHDLESKHEEKIEEPGYHSDEGEPSHWREQNDVLCISRVNSEPLLSKYSDEEATSSGGEGIVGIGGRPPLSRAKTLCDSPTDTDPLSQSMPAATFYWPDNSPKLDRPKLSKRETPC